MRFKIFVKVLNVNSGFLLIVHVEVAVNPYLIMRLVIKRSIPIYQK